MLASLSQETGKPISVLIEEALEGLREHVPPVNGEVNEGEAQGIQQPDVQSHPEAYKPIWEQFAAAFEDVPDEELERLPTDLAANIDHYVYGLPKRAI